MRRSSQGFPAAGGARRIVVRKMEKFRSDIRSRRCRLWLPAKHQRSGQPGKSENNIGRGRSRTYRIAMGR